MRERLRECRLVRNLRAVLLHSVDNGTEDEAVAVVLAHQILGVALDEIHLGRLPAGRRGAELLEQLRRLECREAGAIDRPRGRGEKAVGGDDDALIDLLAIDERVAVDPLVAEHTAEQEETLIAARRGVEAREGADAHRIGASRRLYVRRIDDVRILDREDPIARHAASEERDEHRCRGGAPARV
ncbi:MAG: hypothetical protein JF602_04285 [Gemmatimonadetes bacterium]|nr:hypothetical protein [Gemmatimonadota bacterium]